MKCKENIGVKTGDGPQICGTKTEINNREERRKRLEDDRIGEAEAEGRHFGDCSKLEDGKTQK